jgi:hypothetical protein
VRVRGFCGSREGDCGMAAMLVVPAAAAAGVVQLQQDGRLASRRSPVASTMSGVTVRSAFSSSVSERRDWSVYRIASPKLRFVASAQLIV